MNATKPWYLSRTIWASIVTIAAASASMLGFPVGEVDSSAISEGLLEAVTAISGLVALLGRARARTRIH